MEYASQNYKTSKKDVENQKWARLEEREQAKAVKIAKKTKN
jgi:hypothetical protein